MVQAQAGCSLGGNGHELLELLRDRPLGACTRLEVGDVACQKLERLAAVGEFDRHRALEYAEDLVGGEEVVVGCGLRSPQTRIERVCGPALGAELAVTRPLARR